ncbi:MAG: alpha-E domain-containing protein, partial [Cyclobacteriaceae bacterium]
TKYYKNALNAKEVIHQVLFNTQFPHSISYSLAQMLRYFQRLADFSQPQHFQEIEELLQKLIQSMNTYQQENNISVIEKLIPDIRQQFNHLNARLAMVYFGYS